MPALVYNKEGKKLKRGERRRSKMPFTALGLKNLKLRSQCLNTNYQGPYNNKKEHGYEKVSITSILLINFDPPANQEEIVIEEVKDTLIDQSAICHLQQ